MIWYFAQQNPDFKEKGTLYRLCQFQAVYALEHVRKEEQKKFEASRRKYFKRSRTLLLKHKGKLKADELETVSLILSLSKPLAEAYYLKELAYDFFGS